MQPGQQIGPFRIEKELGSGAMGSVYRAVYAQTGQRVAVKLIAVGLAANSTALARFEREGNILKQLKHPNIVRLFGIGRYAKTPYYAMEYIEGEPLDKILQRRGRQTWEEVVSLGKQLCSALQHAHDKGIVHRDLKPSNLMILPDGTLKLTDFGIAKDLDVTALTGANTTVGTASYMSPEQCRGDRDISPKSDLYSLGVVFYELLTGRKPFDAETPMEMFLKHINSPFERPSRLVPEIPPWLDTLVCQLLEKKPEHRPLNAEMVGKALDEVLEKVQAQQSAGADAVLARAGDRHRMQNRPSEEDREVVRAIRNAAGGKKSRKKKSKPIYQQVWLQAVGILVLLGLAVGGIWLALRPPSAETLFARAKSLMEKGSYESPDKWYEAREGPLKDYLKYYGDRDDQSTRDVRDAILRVDAYDRDKLLTRFVRSQRGELAIKVEPDPERPWQGMGLEAALAENEGDLAKAREIWAALAQKYISGGEDAKAWAFLAGSKTTLLDAVERLAQTLTVKVDRCRTLKVDYLPESEIEKTVRPAVEAEIAGDAAKAREAWLDLKKKHESDSTQRPLTLLAAKRANELKSEPMTPKP